MGFTRYWSRRADISAADWQDIVIPDVTAIFKHVEHVCGVPLCHEYDKPGTAPTIDSKQIWFNGLGEDGHETFVFHRVRSKDDDWLFCKTARKPYDVAVAAVLIYLESVHGAVDSTVDGDQRNWQQGLVTACDALPKYANVLDLPLAQRQADRWTGPWIQTGHGGRCGYEAHFCLDGFGYVTRKKDGRSVGLPRDAFARFLDKSKTAHFARGGSTRFGGYGKDEPDIWNASGSFDETRHSRIGRAQRKVFDRLFARAEDEPGLWREPPAFVRYDAAPAVEVPSYYSLGELLAAINAEVST